MGLLLQLAEAHGCEFLQPEATDRAPVGSPLRGEGRGDGAEPDALRVAPTGISTTLVADA
jgi:hypothetical protein